MRTRRVDGKLVKRKKAPSGHSAHLFRHTVALLNKSSTRDIDPHFWTAAFSNFEAHSCAGRPTRRTNWPVAGCKVPGQNVTARLASSFGALAMRPKSKSCCLSNSIVSGCCPACSRTVLFDTLEMYEWGMPNMSRKHLA